MSAIDLHELARAVARVRHTATYQALEALAREDFERTGSLRSADVLTDALILAQFLADHPAALAQWRRSHGR